MFKADGAGDNDMSQPPELTTQSEGSTDAVDKLAEDDAVNSEDAAIMAQLEAEQAEQDAALAKVEDALSGVSLGIEIVDEDEDEGVKEDGDDSAAAVVEDVKHEAAAEIIGTASYINTTRVYAGKIESVGACRLTGAHLTLVGAQDTIHVTKDWFEHYEPNEGDYFVIDVNGSRSTWASDIFERQFALSASGGSDDVSMLGLNT